MDTPQPFSSDEDACFPAWVTFLAEHPLSLGSFDRPGSVESDEIRFHRIEQCPGADGGPNTPHRPVLPTGRWALCGTCHTPLQQSLELATLWDAWHVFRTRSALGHAEDLMRTWGPAHEGAVAALDATLRPLAQLRHSATWVQHPTDYLVARISQRVDHQNTPVLLDVLSGSQRIWDTLRDTGVLQAAAHTAAGTAPGSGSGQQQAVMLLPHPRDAAPQHMSLLHAAHLTIVMRVDDALLLAGPRHCLAEVTHFTDDTFDPLEADLDVLAGALRAYRTARLEGLSFPDCLPLIS